MKKVRSVVTAFALLIGLLASIIYNTSAGQDFLFGFALKTLMGQSQAQEQPDGLRVVVCGSASPLGNDPTRAQACIAVIIPEHFLLFDVGARSPLRIAQARLPLNRLTGVFLTNSGDTNATDSLFMAAKDADLLLHDALSRTLLDPMIATANELKIAVTPTIMSDVIDYHADTTSLPARATLAGAKQQVFYHMVPVPGNALTEKMFVRGLLPDTVIARDLHTFDLPANSSEILVIEP